MSVKYYQLKEELRWIDDHLFQNFDIAATRQFITNPKSIEAKRLLRICDLVEAERMLQRIKCVDPKRYRWFDEEAKRWNEL